MKQQTGLPQIPEDLVILPNAPFKPTLESIKIQVRGIDEVGFPYDIRTLETRVPRSDEDKLAIAERIGKLVKNTVLHLMELKGEVER